MPISKKNTSLEFIELENNYGAHNYHPLPVVLSKGKGVFVWDVEDKKYYDFLSAYSAVNQGHCHPKITEALINQAQQLTLTSRAFYNNKLGPFEKFLCEYFNFDKALPMNTGAEAVETAIKICRRWAYEIKKIPENEAEIIVCENNFHGRTTTIISFSNDPIAQTNFGPFTNGFIKIKYNNLHELENTLKTNSTIAGLLIEPIQGEAGVYVPDNGYLAQAKLLCEKYNVLFIADEVQTGIGRTGKLLAVDHENIKPDVLILGKAISGGVYPVSTVLANNQIMQVITPGSHGSTFGGNPMAAEVAIAALEVIKQEKLADNAEQLGQLFRDKINIYIATSTIVSEIRGKGLLNAILINDAEESETAWNICVALKNKGLLAKPTHGNIIRFAPPLVINKEQINHCIDIIINVLKDFE